MFGVITGISMEFQFGTNWAKFSTVAGGVIGQTLALEGMMLPSTFDPRFALTLWNSATQPYGLRVGLVWWSIAAVLAAIYFVHLYRSFRGKVVLEGDGY